MAYRRSNGKAKKKQEIVPLTYNFFSHPTDGEIGLTVDPGDIGNFYIDLSQVASLGSRKFFRQGLNWAVGSINIFTRSSSDLTGQVLVSKLPDTWVMANAWEKSFRAWQRMNKEALEEAPSTKPKFLDFKVYADEAHHDIGGDANLLPNNVVVNALGVSTTNVASPGEWEYSKVVIPKTDGTDGVHNRELIATGASFPGQSAATGYDAVSLIEGYAASRGLPDILDPNTPTDMDSASGDVPENWMSALFNDGTTQDAIVLADMQTENNQAPYPFENGLVPGGGGATWTDTYYPGGANQLPGLEVHDFAEFSATTIGNETTLKGGNFMCGLIKLSVFNNGDASVVVGIQLNMVPGPHRGYLCEPMTEV